GQSLVPGPPPLDDCPKPRTCAPAAGMCDSPVKDDGAACVDGNACTQLDECQAGVCVGKNPVPCSAPPDDCHKPPGTCDPATGMCDYPAKLDGAFCDDGSACTLLDQC